MHQPKATNILQVAALSHRPSTSPTYTPSIISTLSSSTRQSATVDAPETERRGSANTMVVTATVKPKMESEILEMTNSATPDCEICALPVYTPAHQRRATREEICPDYRTLSKAAALEILDETGKALSFRSLVNPEQDPDSRYMVIFIRHFFCVACQSYVKTLKTAITAEECVNAAKPFSIVIIGCGAPHMIPHYRNFVGGCPWPIYADPTRRLYQTLGMRSTVKIGRDRPDYMKEISVIQWVADQTKVMTDSLKDEDGIRKRDLFQAGNSLQVGGEFLFENGKVTWCHRMRNFRNHAGLQQLRKVLELD